jgi:hypothetical protein
VSAGADDGHLPRHAAADREGFGHRNGPPDTGPGTRSPRWTTSSALRATWRRARPAGPSVDRLRAAGFGQQQIDGLLARRVADGATAG